MKLIIGLGNPGKAYAGSRHNIGFHCINHLARSHHITFDRRRCHARIGMGMVAGTEVVLAKPQTFMNLSGESVKLLMRELKVPPSDLLVIYDDLDLPLGKIRIRPDGSAGGHKGMESILAALGNQSFARVRVGIGRPQQDGHQVVDYVLGSFHPVEKKIAEETVTRVTEAVHCLLTEGLIAAMNTYN